MRYTLKQLEEMQTHDLADLLSNFVLLLRRLPNVPFSDLSSLQADQETEKPGPDLLTTARDRVNGSKLPEWSKK